MLSNKYPLDPKYKDHALYNDKRFKDCRDCHIEPDWVLIYKYLEEEIVLLLVNTGSHSEVLNKWISIKWDFFILKLIYLLYKKTLYYLKKLL